MKLNNIKLIKMTVDCCICMENTTTNIVSCNTCNQVMHISCVVSLIENSVQYKKCPHCRARLPAIFNHLMKERERIVNIKREPRVSDVPIYSFRTRTWYRFF